MTNRLEMYQIDGSRDNPNTCHTWQVWRENGKIMCHSESGADGKDDYSFVEKKGMVLFLYNSAYKKYAYVREEKFNRFLEDNSLVSVRRKDPNGYWMEESYRYTDRSRNGTIITDGKKENIFDDFWGDDFDREHPGTSCYHVKQGLNVTDATWVIQDNILYTLADIYTLDLTRRTK